MFRSRLLTILDAVAPLAAATAAPARAQSASTTPPAVGPNETSTQEIARKVVNPLTDMVSVPLQFNWINGVGPEKEMQNVIYFQPVVPISLTSRWNVIGRLVTPYVSQPSAFGGSSGLGDVMAQAFFSPKAKGTLTWGVGPMFSLPITSDPTLGFGKWAGGPAAAVVKQHGGMTYGMLVNHIWSFADTGNMPRRDVSMSYIQPVVAHTSRNGVTVVLSTETIANWKTDSRDDRWSVPITAAVSKLTHFGMYPMSVQVGGGYYVAKPENGPSWQLRTTFTLLMPRTR